MYACEKCEAFISKIASTTERKAILRLKYAPLIREIRVDHKVFVVLSYFWFNDLYVMTPEIPLYFDFYVALIISCISFGVMLTILFYGLLGVCAINV
jgi:hypothetical protein